MKLSLGKKLGLVFGSLIILFSIILGISAYFIVKQYMSQDILKNNQQTVRNVRDYYLENRLDGMSKTLNYWSVHPNLLEFHSGETAAREGLEVIGSEWKSYITLNSSVSKVYFASAVNGNLLMVPEKSVFPEDYDPKQRIWYEGARENPNAIYWSKPYIDAEEHQDLVATLSKAVWRRGKVIGVIGMDIRLETLSSLLQGVYANQAGYLVLMGPSGEVYAHPDGLMIGQRAEGVEWANQALKNHEGNGVFIEKGRQWVYSYITLSETGWKLIGIQAVNFTALFQNLKLMSLYTILVVLLVMLLGGHLAGRFILKPLQRMMVTIEAVARGDLEARSPVTSKDEIGAIGAAFNHMLDRISKMDAERNHHLGLLMDQNKEISEQKQEIHSLYEVTDSMNQELEESLMKVREGYLTTVRSLANAIEANDHYTRGHCERVSRLSLFLGAHANLSEKEMKDLEFASILHDIGKIGVSSQIISKAGKLTSEEFEQVRQHPSIGAEILSGVAFLDDCRRILIQHHERIDGGGYPHGLSGESILPSAKILAIADSFDAMTSNRPYRMAALTCESAFKELEKGKGTQFDPVLVDLFVGIMKQNQAAGRTEGQFELGAAVG